MAKSYYEKLKDPRWQKKRLEVLEREKYCCQSCGDKENTLNVHHSIYFKGADPWDDDYNPYLYCLCEACHKDWHDIKLDIDYSIARIGVYDSNLRLSIVRDLLNVLGRDVETLKILGHE